MISFGLMRLQDFKRASSLCGRDIRDVRRIGCEPDSRRKNRGCSRVTYCSCHGVAPGPVNVKVVVLIVLGFITELKSALTVILVTTSVAPLAGNVAITLGNAGLGACSRPQPPARATNTKTSDDILRILNLRISLFNRCVPFSMAWLLHR